ncbi:MAG TPA: hypothetical protein PK079_13325 [Leptospiraceae bacterium]|nr:hypothetical protein [Leptospiraceae bacterium]HMW03722.1 hypothetical protein [Leptospiraceae bacterium]HMX31835.1 hypothetical protein [Leptospiraceae bacterium]HMY29702.1 hypothetical protein [Leptospiraceae bacterium]HMZ64022.1 hypothetical protein [Leptospiraceae bacterium]
MKRRNLTQQPGFGNFKNKCSDLVRRYDTRIVRMIYEVVYENVYWKSGTKDSIQKEILAEVYSKLKEQRISILHLQMIVSEMYEYFGKFLVLLDFGKRRQN